MKNGSMIERRVSAKVPFSVVFGVLFLMAIGCGKPAARVSGLITYEGRPAPDIAVLLQPFSDQKILPEPGVATTDQAGRYEIRSIRSKKKGVEPGRYYLLLGWKDPDADPNPSDEDIRLNKSNPNPYKINPVYYEGDVVIQVPAKGSLVYDIELTVKPEPTDP